jgi:hypothetical protein
MLTVLPDLTFPINRNSINELMRNLVQLNLQDGALAEMHQRGLGIYLHTFDLWCKSGGRIDYRGPDGHARLLQDATTFATYAIVNRHGDLSAAHLGIDFSDTQIRLQAAGQPLLPTDTSKLLVACTDLCQLSVQDEKRVGLLLDVLGKKSPIS